MDLSLGTADQGLAQRLCAAPVGLVLPFLRGPNWASKTISHGGLFSFVMGQCSPVLGAGQGAGIFDQLSECGDFLWAM